MPRYIHPDTFESSPNASTKPSSKLMAQVQRDYDRYGLNWIIEHGLQSEVEEEINANQIKDVTDEPDLDVTEVAVEGNEDTPVIVDLEIPGSEIVQTDEVLTVLVVNNGDSAKPVDQDESNDDFALVLVDKDLDGMLVLWENKDWNDGKMAFRPGDVRPDPNFLILGHNERGSILDEINYMSNCKQYVLVSLLEHENPDDPASRVIWEARWSKGQGTVPFTWLTKHATHWNVLENQEDNLRDAMFRQNLKRLPVNLKLVLNEPFALLEMVSFKNLPKIIISIGEFDRY